MRTPFLGPPPEGFEKVPYSADSTTASAEKTGQSQGASGKIKLKYRDHIKIMQGSIDLNLCLQLSCLGS